MNTNLQSTYLYDLNQIPVNADLYIYGTGKSGLSLLEIISSERKDISIHGFLDTFKKGSLNGYPILCCDDLICGDIPAEVFVLMASFNPTWVDEMIDQINSLGLKNYFVNALILDSIYKSPDLSGFQNDIEWIRQRIDPQDIHLWDIIIETLSSGSSKKLLDWYINSHGSQYFDYVNLKAGNIIIEGGVFDGEHTRKFGNIITSFGKVYAFDPFGDEIILNWSRNNSLTENIVIEPSALWSRSGKLFFKEDGAGSTVSERHIAESSEISSVTIDDFVTDKRLMRLDMIKLDVEGAEKEVLIGAEKSIKKYQPQMAISIYHKISDFFEIPRMIHGWLPNAKFRIKTYSPTPMDTILYVLPG
jgi:FkbM family methyltransferase